MSDAHGMVACLTLRSGTGSLRRAHDDVDAPVLAPPRLRVVRRDGLVLPERLHAEAIAGKVRARLAHEPALHGVRAGLRQGLIARRVAGVVCVTVDLDHEVRDDEVLLERVERLRRFGRERSAARLERDAPGFLRYDA